MQQYLSSKTNYITFKILHQNSFIFPVIPFNPEEIW